MKKDESRIKKKRRAIIVSAAKELFFEQGLARTTMQDIATTVDMARTTMYEYYSSKTGLLTDIRDEYLKELYTFDWEPDDSLSGAELLEELIYVYFERLITHKKIMVFFVEYNRFIETDQIESLGSIDRRSFDIYNKFEVVIRKGLNDKSITFESPKDTILLVLEAIFGIAMRFSIRSEYEYKDGSFSNEDIKRIIPIIIKGMF